MNTGTSGFQPAPLTHSFLRCVGAVRSMGKGRCSVIFYIIILLFLILINGFLAMSELAVMSANKTRLQKRAEEDNANAAAALELARNPHRFLATIQIGITLIGVLSGAFGGASLAGSLAQRLSSVPYIGPYSHSIAMALVVGLITYFSLLAELIPKRIAVYAPEGIASAIAKPMAKLSTLASPVIRMLSVSTDYALKLLRFAQTKQAPVTEEEIRILIDQATAAGVLEEAEQDMVERVFRLADRRVGVMMTPRNEVVRLELSESPEKTIRKIAQVSLTPGFPWGRRRAISREWFTFATSPCAAWPVSLSTSGPRCTNRSLFMKAQMP